MIVDFAIEPLAEDALLLRFGDGIDIDVNARVHAAAHAIRAAKLAGVVDIVPAYATLLVRFELSRWFDNEGARSFDRLAADLRATIKTNRGAPDGGDSCQSAGPGGSETPPPYPTLSPEPEAVRERGLVVGAPDGRPAPRDIRAMVEIPVCYGGEFGEDLDAIAARADISIDEVIARHTQAEYTVAMLGFAPGFPYLLGLDPALHVPRRANPRTRVPAGSVAIGGAQTGIYPRELPGGWNLIGRTPLALFDADREPPCLLAPGDRVRFRAIDADEFRRLAERGA